MVSLARFAGRPCHAGVNSRAGQAGGSPRAAGDPCPEADRSLFPPARRGPAHTMAPRPTAMLRLPALASLIALLVLSGCSAAPRGAYFPPPTDPGTIRVSQALH